MRDKATVFEAGQGKQLSARGSAMFFKATYASTNGAFSLMERTLPPGGRKPPPHFHTNCEEAFYVLEGEVEFTLGKEIFVGGATHSCWFPAAWPTRSAMRARHKPGCWSFTRPPWMLTLKNYRRCGLRRFVPAAKWRWR